MKKKKLGFTLVELLAVIVILAVILVIAVPRIAEVIENSKKATFESSAKTIASTAEKRKMENDILENTNPISCSDVVSLNSEDYSSCTITFDGDIAKVSMVGSGKFEGLQIKNATKDSATVINVDNSIKSATEYITDLYNDENSRTTNFLKKDNTDDENIRYYGANPNNYVKFKDDETVWRIIGIFGNNVKLVRSSSIGNKQWKAGESGVNNDGGINQWGPSKYTSGEAYAGADLQVYLNGEYYTKLSNVTKSAIDYHKWNTAGVEYNTRTDTVAFYNAERGTKTGKECTSGDWCTDKVERTTEWEGYVALAYPTDWAYASATDGCENNMQQQTGSVYTCENDNWMHYNSTTWYLSPLADSGYAFYVWLVYGYGRVDYDLAYFSFAVFPAVYLKSNVVIIDGNGSSESPYILDIE